MIVTHRYAQQPCPYCDHPLDASIGFEDDIEPSAGDVAVCGHCRGFLVWVWKEIPASEGQPEDAELVQEKLSTRAFNELPGDVRADLLRARARLEEHERAEREKGAKH